MIRRGKTERMASSLVRIDTSFFVQCSAGYGQFQIAPQVGTIHSLPLPVDLRGSPKTIRLSQGSGALGTPVHWSLAVSSTAASETDASPRKGYG